MTECQGKPLRECSTFVLKDEKNIHLGHHDIDTKHGISDIFNNSKFSIAIELNYNYIGNMQKKVDSRMVFRGQVMKRSLYIWLQGSVN